MAIVNGRVCQCELISIVIDCHVPRSGDVRDHVDTTTCCHYDVVMTSTLSCPSVVDANLQYMWVSGTRGQSNLAKAAGNV